MKIYLGMSGGVDSSVAALLLKESGADVTGVFMKNWQEDDQKFCSSEQDFADVRAVCDQIHIPYYSFNFEKEYWEHVFTHFLDAFKDGYTPNPDILCNKEIKFAFFLKKCLAAGADKIATGHYARLRENEDGSVDLLRAADSDKDQSYFLSLVEQAALRRVIFPLGELTKKVVRKLAKEADLKVATKPDSTGICFIGERNFAEFLKGYLPAQPGEIVDEHGRVIGQHEGTMYYTLGQRKGLGIGGAGAPWFVAAKDLEKNQLIAVQGENHPLLLKDNLRVKDWHWLNPNNSEKVLSGEYGELSGQIRYRQQAQAVKITKIADNKPVEFIFEEAQRAITPGQQFVLYSDDVCLGSGQIS